MADIELLKTKLQELSEKLATKDKMGLQYTQRVQNSLNTIRTKLTSIIAVYKKNVQDIQSSTSELDKTKKQLTTQQEESKAALEEAARHKAVLQDNLEKTTMELNDLQAQLNRPNPDIPKMQAIIDELRKNLQTAQNESASANAQIEQLKAKLMEYDGLRDKMNQLVEDLLDKIGEILKQVDVMSINQDDIVELIDLLKNTEDMFPKDDESSSSNDGGLINTIGNLFGTSTPASAATSTLQQRTPRGANTAPGQTAPVNLIPRSRGGKTKRYRNRGGYINRLKTKKHRKHTRTNKRRSSRSSKSSSKSSKHSA
jgi:DNA repair exonuclease SbcCD ATPase subunit